MSSSLVMVPLWILTRLPEIPNRLLGYIWAGTGVPADSLDYDKSSAYAWTTETLEEFAEFALASLLDTAAALDLLERPQADGGYGILRSRINLSGPLKQYQPIPENVDALVLLYEKDKLKRDPQWLQHLKF